MPLLDIDGLHFHFPQTWQATKYDDWVYYRQHFVRQMEGIKGVDILAINSNKEAFLVEVKDYRHPDTVKPSDLPYKVCNKVLYTLAALLPTRLHANDPAEQQFAAVLLQCQSLRVVLHVELPPRHRPVVDLADLRQKLKQLLRAVDPHVKVVSKGKMHDLGLVWTVD